MTQAFNPYHKWLGIPPEEQPANHYRLLGIAVFESDPDVIEAAADQRMAHLRNYQAGKHSELSQKLLNEVAAAKICLLNPQKRADYDASLRAEIEAKAAETTPPSPVALDPALVDLFEAVEPSKAVPSACVVGNRQSVSLPVLGAIVLGGLLILGLVAWIVTPSRENPATQTATVAKSEPAQPPPMPPPAVHTLEPAKPTPVVQENPSQSKTAETSAEPKPSAPVHRMPLGPLDAATVRALQQRGATEQSVPWETANSIGMKLVFVPAGELEMGSASAEIERWLGELKDKRVEWQRQLLPSEAPRHRVKITRPFYLGAYEVTQTEYQQVIGRNPSAFSAGGQQKAAVEGKDTGRHPVENVSWEDAMEFCRKLSDSPEEKTAGRVYRLPTEAEWEYACRAGTCAQWNCGDDPATLREVAWFAGCNSGVTHPVGQKSPNALGAYDLHGNVTEWCMDWAGPDYYAYSPANDPQGISSGSARVFRGGGWWSEPVACRSAFRSSLPPMVRHYVQGFRVVCTPGRQVTPEGTPATASSLPDRKPVARWTFDDPKNPGADSSGSGCHGKVFEATYVPDGKAGGALNFQGKGGIDFEPSSLPKSLDFKEMSISWWGNVSPDCPAWSDWWAVANSKIWLVGEVNGKCPEGPYGAPSLYGPGPVAGNFPNLLGTGWHHLVATASGVSGKVLLYCDGKELGALGLQHWFKGRVEKLAIGYAGTCRLDGKPAHVHSLIDDVQLYDYTLSAEDVQFLWTHPGLAIGDTAPGPVVSQNTSQNQTASSSGQAVASSAAAPPKKQSLPSDEVQQRLLRQVDEVYKLAEAKTRLQKLKLARELLDLAKKSESEPAERFVLLRRAMETASDGGDAALMLQAVDAIGTVFDVEVLAVKEKVLLKFAEEPGDSTRIKSFVDTTRGLIDRALAEDRYELALNLATAANRMCAKPAGKELRKAVYDRRQEIQALSDQWKKLEEARATLAKTPDDPPANLALGSWFCFEKDDWAKGLPHLAKGSDEPIKKLAAEELASPPKEVNSQLKLADAWWDLGQSRKGRERDAILLHAGSWYKAVQPGVTGLVKVKVEKRLAETTQIGRPIPPLPPRQPPPAVAPFSAAEARQHQEQWANHLGVPVERTNSLGMKLVLIPPGEFEMGASEEEVQHATLAADSNNMSWAARLMRSEGPQEMHRHRVRITRPLLFGAYEVTVGQFRRFVEATAYRTEAERDGKEERILENNDWKHVANINWRNPGSVQSEDSPVTLVSWNDAVAFCQWVSRQEQMTCRLPTEAEWEYACRAGSSTSWTFGDREQDLGEYAWHLGNSGGQAHPVGQKKPSAWGLYDIHGNVGEWCADWLSGDYYRISPVDDPHGPASGNIRVLRGGRWHLWSLLHRSAFRLGYPPSSRNNVIGFRVVCEIRNP